MDGDTGGNGVAYTSVSVGGGTYEHFYDSNNKRRLKVYPWGNDDEYFYAGMGGLIEDRGNDVLGSGASNTTFPIDEYVWLGGRPVALIRGKVSSAGAHQTDNTGTCTRNSETANCGVYFVVTDHIGKPVLMVEKSGKVH